MLVFWSFVMKLLIFVCLYVRRFLPHSVYLAQWGFYLHFSSRNLMSSQIYLHKFAFVKRIMTMTCIRLCMRALRHLKVPKSLHGLHYCSDFVSHPLGLKNNFIEHSCKHLDHLKYECITRYVRLFVGVLMKPILALIRWECAYQWKFPQKLFGGRRSAIYNTSYSLWLIYTPEVLLDERPKVTSFFANK